MNVQRSTRDAIFWTSLVASLVLVARPASAQVITATDVIAGPIVSGQVVVSGFAFDVARPFDGIESVHVQSQRVHPDGSFGEWTVALASYGVTRPDVAAVWGLPMTQTGFSRQLPWLGPGTWRILVSVVARTGFVYPSLTTITIGGSVFMWTDTPTPGSARDGRSFDVAGWAVDLASPLTPTVTVCARDVSHPELGCRPLGTAIGGQLRPDVAQAFGPQFPAAGWSVHASDLAPGAYDLVVSAQAGGQGTSQVLRVRVH